MNVDARNVESLARKKEDENYDLRQYLKWQDDLSEQELDQRVFELADQAFAGVDCATCANCCKGLNPGVTDAEALRLADRLSMSVEEFRSRYLKAPEPDDEDPDDASWTIRQDPCPFLADNRCTLYKDRPEECREYPYLHKPEFSHRTLGMIERTFTCPIVYQVFEELKARLPFRHRQPPQW